MSDNLQSNSPSNSPSNSQDGDLSKPAPESNREGKRKKAGGGEASQDASEKTITSVPLPASSVSSAVIETIRAKQRERVFAIKQQGKADRACEAFIAGKLGYQGPATPEEDRKRIFAEAQKLRKILEEIEERRVDLSLSKANSSPDKKIASLENKLQKAEEKLEEGGFDKDVILSVRGVVLASAAGRHAFDELRESAEKVMVEAAEELPAAAWVKNLSGMDMLGLAVIVGEAGNLTHYPTVGKLWKRLGLAPYDGCAASTWRRDKWRPRTLTTEEWETVGFKPSRLGQIYGVVTVPLFFNKAKNVYGELYKKRRALTGVSHPDWSDGHSDKDARRYMTKMVLKHIWNEWKNADLP